jgi:hypothetical protein
MFLLAGDCHNYPIMAIMMEKVRNPIEALDTVGWLVLEMAVFLASAAGRL